MKKCITGSAYRSESGFIEEVCEHCKLDMPYGEKDGVIQQLDKIRDCHGKCDYACDYVKPYGFVPETGCNVHDSITEDERKEYKQTDMDERETKIKKLFDMVYEWGRVGIVVDFESNAFRKALKEILLANHTEN